MRFEHAAGRPHEAPASVKQRVVNPPPISVFSHMFVILLPFKRVAAKPEGRARECVSIVLAITNTSVNGT